MEIKDATTTSLADDLKELNLERPITKQALKSNEELEQLTVDEKLTDIERAVYLLSSGQEVQRISVINNLPDLLRDSHADCMRRVVPKVREVLHVAQTDMQLAASSAFLQILQKDLVPIQNYTSTFLQTILSSVDSKDSEIAAAWLDTLLDVIDLLPKEIIKKDILGIAIEKGQLSQPVQARLSCCKILGKIATRFEPFVIKKEILPVVQSLCQDVEYEVRGCMCWQLDPVARGLGLEATKSAILPEIVELTNDEESYVRIAGLETVVNLLSLVDEDVCRGTLIPLVCKFCQQAMKTEDHTLFVVAKQFGKLCHGFLAYLTDEQKQWFVDFFKQLCRVGLSEKSKNAGKDAEKESPTKDSAEGPVLPDILELQDRQTECRINCAFNIPAMVLFVGAKHFKSELSNCFNNLCKDPHITVRKTVAYGFHEVIGLLGSHVTQLLGDLIILLKDEATEVLKGLITYLPTTIKSVCGSSSSNHSLSDSKHHSHNEIIPALLGADIVITASNDWRLQEMIVKHFTCFYFLASSETIYNKILPVLFQKLKTARAIPVRLACAHSTLYLIRNLKKQEQRDELLHQMVQEFCHGRSCHHRSLFIDICKMTMELYSKTFFKEHFFEYLLSLHLDPIPNVRLRLCSVLPDLKCVLKLPTDRAQLQQLDSCIRKLLIAERDRDVCAAIKIAVEELDRIPIQMESLTRRLMDDEDLGDKKKEEEEKKLVELEEKEAKKEEEARAAKAEKKGHSKDGSKIPGPKKVGGKTTSVSTAKPDRGSAGVKRTPSNSTSSSSPSSSKVEPSESKIPQRKPLARTKSDSTANKSTTKLSRSGISSVPTPSSAGSRTGGNVQVPVRRGSLSNASSTGETKVVRKNSNGSIPTSKTKKTSK